MPFWRNNSSFTLNQPDFLHIVMQSIFSLAGYDAFTAEHTTFRRGGRFRFPNGLLAPSSTAAPPFLPHPNPAELMPSSTGQLALDDWEKMHSPNFRPLLPPDGFSGRDKRRSESCRPAGDPEPGGRSVGSAVCGGNSSELVAHSSSNFHRPVPIPRVTRYKA